MKCAVIILLLFIGLSAFPQSREEKLINSLKEFHRALVNKNPEVIDQYTHKRLSYGHSNGWIETKSEMIKNLETGFISYSKFNEDSITVNLNDKLASVRFIGDITATLNGKQTDYHLKVMEVWVRKGGKWKLFARQALK